jgi:nucleotide-binding universal stress UspA family protein
MFYRLREVLPLGADLSYPPICIVRHGLPSDEILQVSDARRADLILLGVRSAGWRLAATIHLTESTAYKIVTRATCPVLTVRG